MSERPFFFCTTIELNFFFLNRNDLVESNNELNFSIGKSQFRTYQSNFDSSTISIFVTAKDNCEEWKKLAKTVTTHFANNFVCHVWKRRPKLTSSLSLSLFRSTIRNAQNCNFCSLLLIYAINGVQWSQTRFLSFQMTRFIVLFCWILAIWNSFEHFHGAVYFTHTQLT